MQRNDDGSVLLTSEEARLFGLVLQYGAELTDQLEATIGEEDELATEDEEETAEVLLLRCIVVLEENGVTEEALLGD